MWACWKFCSLFLAPFVLGMTWFSWFPTGSTRQTHVAQCGLALLLCPALSKAPYEESTALVQAEAKHGQVDMQTLMRTLKLSPDFTFKSLPSPSHCTKKTQTEAQVSRATFFHRSVWPRKPSRGTSQDMIPQC